MEQTLRLNLPFIQASQAQKHITHNEAIQKLDQITQLSVISRAFTAPPAAPNEGDRYIVPQAGEWDGAAGDLQLFEGGGWVTLTPQKGWVSWVEDAQELLVFDGATWIKAMGSATFDTLSVHGTSAYFSADSDASGFYLTVAKTDDTQSVGIGLDGATAQKALMELTPDDHLRITVTKDGSTYHDALRVDLLDGTLDLARTPRVDVRTNYDNAIAAGTATQVNLNDASLNPLGLHDASAGTITVDHAGTYMVGYTLGAELAADTATALAAHIHIASTDAIDLRAAQTATAIGTYSLGAHGLVSLAAGEVLSLHITSTGQSATVLPDLTRMWCVKVA